MDRPVKGCLLFDWGDTLMRVFPEYPGPMQAWPKVAALPGAAGTLERLHRDWLIGLATNAADSSEDEIRGALRRVDLERWLDKIYCFKKLRLRKPAPEFFAFILEDLDLPPERAIMVGDDYETDVQGALRAGLRAVWLNLDSTVIPADERSRSIRSLSELPGVLENWRLA